MSGLGGDRSYPAWNIVRDDGHVVGACTTPEAAEVVRGWHEQEEPRHTFWVEKAGDRTGNGDRA